MRGDYKLLHELSRFALTKTKFASSLSPPKQQLALLPRPIFRLSAKGGISENGLRQHGRYSGRWLLKHTKWLQLWIMREGVNACSRNECKCRFQLLRPPDDGWASDLLFGASFDECVRKRAYILRKIKQGVPWEDPTSNWVESEQLEPSRSAWQNRWAYEPIFSLD